MFQSFQRIQRNRQSRIRVKLCRRAGKRQDEILEEDVSNADDDIDIVGEEKEEEKKEEKKECEKKSQKQGLYGPDQFTEADVLVVANELEKDEPVSVNVCDDRNDISEEDIKQEDDGCQKRWCSQCQVGEKTALLECNGPSRFLISLMFQGSMGEAVVSLSCWHVHCKKCWLTQLVGGNWNIKSI